MSHGRFSAGSQPSDTTQSGSPASRKKAVIAVICAAVLILAAVGFFLIRPLLDPFRCCIAPDVTIAGLSVSGMTKGQARKALQSALEETLYAQNLTVILPQQTLSLSPGETGVRADVRDVVDDAYEIGRSQPLSTADIDLRPYLTVSEESLRASLQDYANQYDTVFQEAGYILSGEAPDLNTETHNPDAPCQTLELTVGVPEAHLDVDDTYDRILSAYGQAIAACGEGQYEVSVEIPAQAVPEQLDIDAIFEEVSIAPADDSLDMTTYAFVPGTYGYTFDTTAAEEALSQAAPGETVSIPMTYVEPEILGEDVYFRDVLGSCETPHGDNANRNNNLRLLCETLNGMVLQPGEEFSYNQALGERTAEKGYLPAPAYSGNRLTNAIGGGVCQGSSTLYNCVLLADLEVVTRVCHGATVAYLPMGLDAAVNWGTTDFVFRNNFHFPIKIQAEETGTTVKMEILGTDEKDYYIVMTSGYDDSNPTVIYAVSYKNKYDKQTGELISKEREAFSTYYRNIG